MMKLSKSSTVLSADEEGVALVISSSSWHIGEFPFGNH